MTPAQQPTLLQLFALLAAVLLAAAHLPTAAAAAVASPVVPPPSVLQQAARHPGKIVGAELFASAQPVFSKRPIAGRKLMGFISGSVWTVKLMYKGRNLFDRAEAAQVTGPGEQWEVPAATAGSCGNVVTGSSSGVVADTYNQCELPVNPALQHCQSRLVEK
jgi:hypothetical protein